MSPGADEHQELPGRRQRRPRYKGTHPRQFPERYKELNPAGFPSVQDHVRAQGRTPAGTHVPVLVDEVLAALNPQRGEVVADCTIGYGGHALEFMKRIGSPGRLIGMDLDAAQLQRTEARLRAAGHSGNPTVEGEPLDLAPLSLHHSHFAGLGKILARERLEACDIVFADLGVSSMQIDDPERGFSYKHDGPLDMRMDRRLPRSAADILAQLSLEELAAALATLGGEPQADRIARTIVQRRAVAPLQRTRTLVDLIFGSKGISHRGWRERPKERQGDLHPAARTFQALRILVNDELAGLAQFLRAVPYCLRGGARVGIISFHSGEDRLVEDFMQKGLEMGLFAAACKSPVRPSAKEITANPRSRSAVFRWAVQS